MTTFSSAGPQLLRGTLQPKCSDAGGNRCGGARKNKHPPILRPASGWAEEAQVACLIDRLGEIRWLGGDLVFLPNPVGALHVHFCAWSKVLQRKKRGRLKLHVNRCRMERIGRSCFVIITIERDSRIFRQPECATCNRPEVIIPRDENGCSIGVSFLILDHGILELGI